jgi:sugar O-acyltransferase (sialic acid O-acetyltransferase NeuD family)
MNRKKLIIIGAGDFAREVMYCALQDISSEVEKWQIVGFVDEYSGKMGTTQEKIEIISFARAAELNDDSTYFTLGVGEPILRWKLYDELLKHVPKAQFATIIHQNTVIMPNAIIEKGVFIGPNTTIAIGCHIKLHVLVNQNVSIGHDCVIGEFSVISPGCVLSGRTIIGEATFLGSGVVTYPKVQIGSRCVVSANAVVSRNLKDNYKQILKPNTMMLPPKQNG